MPLSLHKMPKSQKYRGLSLFAEFNIKIIAILPWGKDLYNSSIKLGLWND